MLIEFNGHRPQTTSLPFEGFIADTARVIGQVLLGQRVSVWYGATIRADNHRIILGDDCNIQENAVLHTDPGVDLILGNGVTVGHLAMLHGCTIGDHSLIGINSVILNGAVIGRNCLIGANTLIPEGKVIPDNAVVMGSPGKVVRIDETGRLAAMHQLSAAHYAARGQAFSQTAQPFPIAELRLFQPE